MLTTLYDYFEKAKEAAIAANDRDAINCFTWIMRALNTESYKKRTVYPDILPRKQPRCSRRLFMSSLATVSLSAA